MAKYELLKTSDEGIEHRLYENGAIRNQWGQLLVLPDVMQSTVIRTADAARELHKIRKQKVLDAIEQSVMTVTRTNIPYEAIGMIVGKRAEIAMSDNTRIGNEAAKIVLQAIDAYQDKHHEVEHVERQVHTIDPDTMRIVEQMIVARRTNVLDNVEIMGKIVE